MVDKFRIEPIPGETLHSYIIFDESSKIEVEGVTIEAQFKCSRGYLVVMSDGNPFEEMLHFYLVGERGELLDGLSLGRIYHSGVFRNITPHSDDRLEFSFFGKERWSLVILNRARFQLWSPFSSVSHTGQRFRAHYLKLKKIT